MPKSHKKTVLVDFDSVIHKYSVGYHDGTIYDEPVEGALQMMEKLNKIYKVVIFTTRLNPDPFGESNSDNLNEFVGSDKLSKIDQIRILKGMIIPKNRARQDLTMWLDKHGFELGRHYESMTFLKQAAVAYIDDRAIRFQDWDDQNILNLLTK